MDNTNTYLYSYMDIINMYLNIYLDTTNTRIYG